MDRYIPGWGLVQEADSHIIGDSKILDDPEHIYNTGEGNVLCYHPHRDIWFYSSPYSILKGEYELNRKYICEYYATEGALYKYWKLPEKFWNLDECGWSEYQGEINYGHIWIDFYHYSALTRGGKPVMVIEEVILPYPDYLEPD